MLGLIPRCSHKTQWRFGCRKCSSIFSMQCTKPLVLYHPRCFASRRRPNMGSSDRMRYTPQLARFSLTETCAHVHRSEHERAARVSSVTLISAKNVTDPKITEPVTVINTREFAQASRNDIGCVNVAGITQRYTLNSCTCLFS